MFLELEGQQLKSTYCLLFLETQIQLDSSIHLASHNSL